MKINIKVNTNAKNNSVTKIDESNYSVAVNTSPEQGKANKKIIDLLADYFEVKKSQVFIVSGKKSKNKVVDIVE